MGKVKRKNYLPKLLTIIRFIEGIISEFLKWTWFGKDIALVNDDTDLQ